MKALDTNVLVRYLVQDDPNQSRRATLFIERAAAVTHPARMSKSKNPGTGEGFLGEIMVHRITRAVGVVENVVEGRDNWAPQLTLKLADGSVRKGRLSASERKALTPPSAT